MVMALGAAGCGDTTSSADMTMSMSMPDMALHGDLATAVCVDAGPKHFGDACTTDCECDTSMCRMFQMGAVHLCTKPCTPATAGTDCPPPSVGTCTNNGYCKF